ncbi:MAG: GNAT family N-acetyltransferase [Gammaproteobacteria bacterium]|nr:GNAT family N-acetyltransferase [Gammaproteobacteria bacterium]
MTILIVPTAQMYFDGLWHALDAVARERRFLAFTAAPPTAQAYAFFNEIVEHDRCQFVALKDGAVIGWCDILPVFGDARAHVGVFGIGVVVTARHCGVGKQLMEHALRKAREKGFVRIELTVRADNGNAIALYERFGFVHEGQNKKAFYIEGEFYDTLTMALVQ